jgi:uncharacterized protein GlcG (DUF336 family)
MTTLFETAKLLAQLSEERASKMNVPITISVIDVHGNLVLKHRMTGAPLISIEMSERKAYTSALTFMATKDVTPLAQPGQRMHTITDFAGGRFVAFGGGVPLVENGQVIGGVGVSGGTTEEDLEIVEGALEDLHEKSPSQPEPIEERRRE